jgi:hypothetical protein
VVATDHQVVAVLVDIEHLLALQVAVLLRSQQ